VFKHKIEAIKLKKQISFCLRYVNRGQEIEKESLNRYIEGEMAKYYGQLDSMMEQNESVKKDTALSEYDFLSIKKIYRRMVKLIHPDINNLTEKNEELSDLWDRLLSAYTCNNLKGMEEVEVLIYSALERIGDDNIKPVIEDIDEKIADVEREIYEITNTDPYMYKKLLGDEEAVEFKKEELQRELEELVEHINFQKSMYEDIKKRGGM
jgi:hypothetical protein